MGRSAQTGMVQTVLGPLSPDRLGVTLTHEHLLIDLSFMFQVPDEAFARDVYWRPLSLETLGYVNNYAMANLDDSRLLDIDTAIEEAKLFKQHGGSSLVDATSIGIARDPVSLARDIQGDGAERHHGLLLLRRREPPSGIWTSAPRTTSWRRSSRTSPRAWTGRASGPESSARWVAPGH